jgi:hypothetical protein
MGGCIASDRITVDGALVGAMVREASRRAEDSGWIFSAGDEDQAYYDDASRWSLYHVNTIANYDPEILPYLYALPGQRFDRDGATRRFVEAPDSLPNASVAGLPAGITVVQGRYRMTEQWSIDLPTPFRRRVEDRSLVLWRPGLTFWIKGMSGPHEPPGVRLAVLRKTISPGAFDVATSDEGDTALLTYRLREDTTTAAASSLYAITVKEGGWLQMGIYLDRESDLADAHQIAKSVRSV